MDEESQAEIDALEKRKTDVMMNPLIRHMLLSLLWGFVCIYLRMHNHLDELLFISRPFEWLIPNIGFYAEQSPDPSFTRVFISGSFIIYIILFFFYIKSLDDSLGVVYSSKSSKISSFVFAAAIFFLGGIMPWLISIDVSGGVHSRGGHWVAAGVASHFGVIFALNALLVTAPMFFFQVIAWAWFTGSVKEG